MVEVNYKGLRINVVSFCDLGMNYETTAQLTWPGSGSLQTLNGPDDMGRVIGKHGKIAKAIRQLMKAAANGTNKKVTIDIE